MLSLDGYVHTMTRIYGVTTGKNFGVLVQMFALWRKGSRSQGVLAPMNPMYSTKVYVIRNLTRT